MTLVGPRPLILDEDQHVDELGPQRLDLKPGITGLWQVLGASDIPFEEMVEARLPLRHELVAARGSASDHVDAASAGPRASRLLNHRYAGLVDGMPAAHDGRTSCRFCAAPLELTVVDLGMSPLCESFLPAERIEEMEPFYPLHVGPAALLARAAPGVRVARARYSPSTPTSRRTRRRGSSTRASTSR